MPHMFEWIEMEIAKNREEYGLIKTDLPKQSNYSAPPMGMSNRLTVVLQQELH